MAIKTLNNRRLLNKDEEDERKQSGNYFVLPTFEELQAIEKQAKEDAAKAVSSEGTDMRTALKTFVEREGRLPDVAPGQGLSRTEAPLSSVKQTENNKVLYGLANLGAGFVSGVSSAANGIESMVKDVFTGGKQGEQINAIERYLTDHENERDTLMRSASYDEDRAVSKIAKSAGVSENAVRDYKKNGYSGYIKQSNDAWAEDASLGAVEKFLLGEGTYQIGQQLPGMMLGAAGGFSSGGTIVDSVKKAATTAKGTGTANMVKAIGTGAFKGIVDAAKGSLTTNLMALNAAGSKYFTNQQQYGNQKKVIDNIVDSAATGFIEQFTEHIGGFTDIGSVDKFLDSRTGSTAATLAKTILKAGLGMAEEGAEEIINVPLGGIVDKITFEPDKKWFGEGGVFDFKEMAKAGASGALIGGLMGGLGTVASVADVVTPANKNITGNVLAINANAQNFNPAEIRAAVEVLNRTAEEYGIPEGIADARTVTVDDVQRVSAKILDAVRMRAEDLKTNTQATQRKQSLSMNTNPRIAEIERTGRAVGADEGVMALARDVSSLTGRGVRFFSEAENDGYINNGFYDPDSNTININVKSKNPSAQILSHELTHSIENTDSYLQLRSVIFDRMKRDGMDLDAEYRKKELMYNDAGYRLRDEGEIAHEIIAEQIEKRYLTDEASIRSLVSENRTLGQRIREWFDSLLAKMGNAEAKERDYVRQVRDLYARALGESVQGAQQNAEVKHSLTWINDAGIEVYETSPETKALTWNERKARYLDIMKNEYQGRTARFTRNGHVYYAKYDPNSLRKPIYGDNRSSPNGVKAVIKSGADGDLFNLVENSQYTGSKKNTKNHTSADYFDYFVKTVQIDGKVFDLMADVEKNYGVDGGYVYTLALVDNKKIKASPAHGTPTVPVNNAGSASGNSISQDSENVNRKFSVSKVVEETKDLIAVHNLNADKLVKSLALGGMPMPSIAIAKAEGGHENFGDISLVFDKSTIDPQASAANKVYSGDAWTPTYPTVEYKVNDAVERRVRDKYYDLAKRIGYDEARAMYRYAENLDDSLNRDGGEDAMLQRLYDDTGMMQIYLQDVGRGKVEPIMREVTEKMTEGQVFFSEYLIEVLGEDLISGIKAPDGVIPSVHRRAYMEAHGAEIREAYKQMRIELYGDSETEADQKAKEVKTMDLLKLLNDAYRYIHNGGTTVKTVTDTNATDDAIRAAAADGYREWIDGLFRGVQEKSGIRNQQDTFTKSGNRRSFEATHYETTLENVVRAMKESGEKGVGSFGGGNIFGASTQDFSSIEDIKKSAGRLQNLTEDEFQEIKRGFRERFSELAGSLPKNKDSLHAMDAAANMLVEAVVKYKTKKGIDGYLRRESQGWANYSPDVTEELISLVNDIRAMPTQYFEAKPQRAVSFDEVAAFVIPRNADIKVKQELLNRGYSIAEYDPDVPGDRAKVLNGMDKYKFSISKSDDPDNKRVMPKRSAAGTKARARQEQQARMRFEQKVMNRGFDNLSPAEQEHYRDEIVGQYRRKYDDYKKKRDALISSGYQFAGVDDYAEKVVGSVEDAAIDANTFLIHYQEGVFGDTTREDVQDFALDYLQMIGAHRPDTSETYVETQDSVMPGDEDVPPERVRGVQMEYDEPEAVDVDGEGEPKLTRKVLHKTIMDGIKEQFLKRGLDLDRVLAKAKDLSTFSTVDNTPQRVMEKSLGYQAGQVLSDLTVNRVAENETAGIRWLNQYTSKDGVIAGLAKKYNIKPGSKESAAAQMYAEGFYVNEYDEIVEYGDRELAADFQDAQVQKNIKGLARDPVIRQIYDQTLDAINASRARNAYPEIQKLDNYYLHFRAMDDTFSRLGVPFNPNDIRAKDLPTDLSGVTADLKPGQPYFASAMHRKGKRTSFDLLGGLEKYLTSAKNQIYHIDDIQTLRALRNYIADMYGQGNGLQGLDDMDEDAVQERIKQVYDSHLSTFAKFLNEEANIIAGKTSLIDRGLEGVIGRRGITFLNDVNRQVGANMVGWNISSSLTNVLPVVQAFAKTNKLAFVKGFAQTVQNRLASITGKGDGFAETSDVIVRRKGADRYHRTPWQKASDAGYLLMGMVDDISTEIIARAKYNELTAKGMDAEAANRETDKWVSRLMGDRSLGQMPQIFNSKMLGMITKFQLEVRNQIDAQFYDTIKEAQADYAEIGDKAKRNAKIAAKVTATFAELAIAQHLFGAVFESIAGYNPAFDIIEVLAKAIGLDDDEESEDTVLDNIEQGVLALIEDLPYSSVLMDGGRVPISAAMPIGDIIKGEDQYGNEVNRLQTAAEALPYYVLPGGYGQIKKTAQGLSMFMGDKPVTGSYTDSGNLRFPVDATPGNVAQAAVFGQWANEGARDYFDNERKPISERQAQGYAESDLEWKEYQKYKAQITKFEKGADKVSAIKELDISPKAKEALYRSLVATTVKDEDGNIIGTSEDGKIEALYNVGLDFNDFLDVKMKQASLNADESLSGNGRATRFLAWVSKNGYTDAQADVIGEQFPFSSGFRVSPTTYQKMVDGGVEPDNAVTFSDALSGTERAIDKINAMWGTGIGGKQLDAAIKAVVSEKQYDRYRIIIDANVPLEAYTWVLDNADADGNDSVSNAERELALSRLALSRAELSALWLATGGSEKSNPYKGSAFGIQMPEINAPKIDMPELDFNIPHFDFEFNFGGNKT